VESSRLAGRVWWCGRSSTERLIITEELVEPMRPAREPRDSPGSFIHWRS
jgi:hypothetical protein